MVWTRRRSTERIEGFKQNVPEATVMVRRLEDQEIASRLAQLAQLREAGHDEPLVFNVGVRDAVLVNGVHVYAQLIDYNENMVEQGIETEASHSRILGMLHLHYSACDRVVESFGAQRVDYHGPRLHAVVLSPGGAQGARERAVRALALAQTLQQTIELSGRTVGGGRYGTRVRIGLDAGSAVAVNSGRRSEPEPLFLGSPANHAAKLAEGYEPGIFLSDRVRHDLMSPGLVSSNPAGNRQQMLASDVVREALISARTLSLPMEEDDIRQVVRSLEESSELFYLSGRTTFSFRRHEPPLKTIDFTELMPSNSIRMDLASLFADIDGFTAYVDRCIKEDRVREMIVNLHVLRSELAASFKEDFGGRKVRFIGDCLHGLSAEGTKTNTNASETVLSAVKAAGGLRSSFELCQQSLTGINDLGLAIGIELGPTPVTRLGIRGNRSVRCATSEAVSGAELCQTKCKGDQTALGPKALNAAPPAIRRLFPGGVADGLDYSAVQEHTTEATSISDGVRTYSAQSHCRH